MRPLFTVGIPVYNGMPYLPEAVESILSQSFPQFRLLVVNDGSTDGSLEYLNSIRDVRLRVISQSNQGLTATLNRLLREADTPWLVRLDADDVAAPNRLALLNEAINQYADAGMFYSEAGHYGHPQFVSKMRTTRGSPDELRELTENGHLLSICHVTAALNVDKTRALGGYRFNLHVEDIDLWWRMALRHQIVFLPTVTVWIRLRDTSTCFNHLRALSLNTLYVQYLLLSHLWNLNPLRYDVVSPLLAAAIDERRLEYRHEMWRAGSCIGARHYWTGLRHLARACARSPKHFCKRVRDAVLPTTSFPLGMDPSQFRMMRQQLWDSAHVHER